YFGKRLSGDRPFRGSCLLTHLHWDHVQGLPFFTPLLREGSSLDVHGPAQEDGRTLHDVVSSTIRPPLFPVSVAELPGSVRFHDTADTDFSIGGFNVMARLIPHLGPTLGFRVEWQGRSIAYLSDHQQPSDGSFSAAPGAFELVEGVDLLIHDAQYTLPEFQAKATWGHCTIDYAVWLAAQAGVKQLALFHHDPSRRDDDLDAMVRCAAEVGARNGVDVIAASEGLVLELA
ncbi:MAG: MBL fold metallo-hydrolase, partial [Actinomycetota bacterium]|nr:MBL fold metallo-hydrolase [Actinomycetota bacterium]